MAIPMFICSFTKRKFSLRLIPSAHLNNIPYLKILPNPTNITALLVCILLQLAFSAAYPAAKHPDPTKPAHPNRQRDLEGAIRHYRFYKPDSALLLIRKGMADCQSKKDYSCIGEMHNHLGIIHENRGRLESARACYQLSIKAFRQSGDSVGIANELNRLGVLALRKSNYPDAANHFFAALKLYQQQAHKAGIAECY
ncbi:MAG: tetratricopeptide repeat protein, partial [Sphingobacteriales bacterium]